MELQWLKLLNSISCLHPAEAYRFPTFANRENKICHGNIENIPTWVHGIVVGMFREFNVGCSLQLQSFTVYAVVHKLWEQRKTILETY